MNLGACIATDETLTIKERRFALLRPDGNNETHGGDESRLGRFPSENSPLHRIDHDGHVVAWLENVIEGRPVVFLVNALIPAHGHREITVWFRAMNGPPLTMLKIQGRVSFHSPGGGELAGEDFPLWVYTPGNGN
jgi:hypothetical protein